MERTDVEQQVSGWFMGCLGDHDHNDTNELQLVSVYEAMLRNPRALPYVGLPSGVMLAKETDVPTVFFNGQLVTARRGSFVARLSERA
jgi:hypothetical protein